MHAFAILLGLLVPLLVSCTQPSSQEPVEPPTGQGDTVEQGAKEGEFCGGIAAFQCADGLRCRYDGNYPDAGGKCVKA